MFAFVHYVCAATVYRSSKCLFLLVEIAADRRRREKSKNWRRHRVKMEGWQREKENRNCFDFHEFDDDSETQKRI
jgi:hypothetical protein